MKNNSKSPQSTRALIGIILLALTAGLGAAWPADAHAQDSLYIGDRSDKPSNRIVPNSDPNAPAVPRGMALSNNNLLVTELTAESRQSKPPIPGRLLKCTLTGEFVDQFSPPAGSLGSYRDDR